MGRWMTAQHSSRLVSSAASASMLRDAAVRMHNQVVQSKLPRYRVAPCTLARMPRQAHSLDDEAAEPHTPRRQRANTHFSKCALNPARRTAPASSDQLPLGVYIPAHPAPALLGQEFCLRNSSPITFAEGFESDQLDFLPRAPQIPTWLNIS